MARNREWADKARDRLRAELLDSETGEGRRMRFILTEVQPPIGSLQAIVVPISRAPDDSPTLIERSLNAALLRDGLATQDVRDWLPPKTAQVFRSIAKESEAAKAGMYADMVRDFDLDAEELGVVSPWLARRACLMIRRGYEPAAYAATFPESHIFQDADSGEVVEFLRADGRTLRQMRPIHSVTYHYKTE